MADDTKKVFLSYRRALHTDFVHRLRDQLKGKGYDVFLDVQSIPSGKFAEIILHEIEARPHFVVILVPDSLQKTKSETNWYRREIEHALEKKRNIVPLLAKGFDFEQELRRMGIKQLPGRLDQLKQYQQLLFNYDYDEQFTTNIDILVKRFLSIPEETKVVPTPKKERRTVQELSKIADLAKADPSGTKWLLPPNLKWPSLQALPAPKLEILAALPSFKWSTIEGASGYVLECSMDEAFSEPTEVYSGNDTQYTQFSPTSADLSARFTVGTGPFSARSLLRGKRRTSYYRVKAEGGLGTLDSPWSNVVTFTPPKW